MKEVVVVSIGRTPMGAFGGAFKGLSAIELGVAAVKGAFSRTKVFSLELRKIFQLKPEEVQDVYLQSLNLNKKKYFNIGKRFTDTNRRYEFSTVNRETLWKETQKNRFLKVGRAFFLDFVPE